jgi:hypothetical protein
MAAPTDQLGLARPDDNATDWGDDYRAAMDTLDKMANAHVGPTQPAVPGPYLWVQTGLGASGTDFTFWIEDGT